MEFVKEDWDLRGFNPDRWVGETMEHYYRMAVIVGNRSAIETYEAWVARKPIIADEVQMQGRYYYGNEGGYTHGEAGTRKRERLVIGCQFVYRGETVEVTSFAAGAANCCSYKPQEKDERGYDKGPRKIMHRYTVTPESIRLDRAERKAKEKLIDALKVAVNGESAAEGLGKQIAEFLKVPADAKEAFLFALPIKILQSAVAKFC
jgi:hypothetical protein